MAIVTSGLIGYWNAKQGISGSKWSNIAPGKTGLNDGTMANVTLTNNVPTFNGSTSKVTIPFSGVTNFTFEFFVTPNNTGGAHGIFGSDGNNRLMVEGQPDSDASLKLGGTSYYGGTGLILFGQVNHIAIVVTPTSAKWYVNGVLDQNYTISAAFAWGTSFIFGWVSSGYYLNGLFHSAKLYDRLLTDPEISQNYSNGVEVGLTTSVEQIGVANLLGLGLLSADGQVTSNVNSSANLLGVGILTATATTTSQSTASANFVGTGVLTASGIQIINNPVSPLRGKTLYITDIYGNTEALTAYKGLKRFRSVSGEKTLAFLILPTEQNAHSFDMVQEESVVDFDGDTYRIKQMNEKNKGQTYYKEVVAIHTFFDLIDEYVYETFTGSKTFEDFLQFVFTGTSYTWDIVDSFYAQDWENIGDNNPLALFQDGLKRYGAEFTLIGTHLTFKQKIGNATDFQFRYNYNIKTINRSVNTNNLSTYIKGFGKKNEDGTYLIQSEYTSPNSTIFGIKHAKPVKDERYTTIGGLNERLIAELKDTPDVSITLEFVDLRRAGFPYDVPNEGDDSFLIFEPMNNLDLETRIMDIAEEFTEFSDYPVKTDVTLANFRNNMTNQFVEFSRTQKTVDSVMDGSKKIPYNALDDAVKRATAALQSAQTELEFENGIIARDKNNPNFIVLLNSNGIGISRDGGQTFKEAITSEGFVLSAGAIGQLAANNIQIGPETTFEMGYAPEYGEIFVRGTGWNRPANRVIKLNGQTIFDGGGRGIQLVIFDRNNFEIFYNITLDTYGSPSDRDALGNHISWFCDNRPDVVFILASYDAISWNDWNMSQMKRIGASNFPSNRTPYAFVGMPNIGEGAGIQVATGEGATDAFAEISTKVINGMAAGINMQASSLREDLRLAAPLPTSLTLDQDGIKASNPDGTRYLQLDYRGGYAKRGAFTVERDDGYITMIDGKLNQSFDVFGSDPPYMVDTHMNGRYFQLNTGVQQGTCQIYTLDRKARYLKLQVTLGSEVAGSGCTFFVTSTSDNNTWLGSFWTTNGYADPGQSWITLDLGIPDGSEYAIYCLLRSDNPSYFCQGRITRIKQTDFL